METLLWHSFRIRLHYKLFDIHISLSLHKEIWFFDKNWTKNRGVSILTPVTWPLAKIGLQNGFLIKSQAFSSVGVWGRFVRQSRIRNFPDGISYLFWLIDEPKLLWNSSGEMGVWSDLTKKKMLKTIVKI